MKESRNINENRLGVLIDSTISSVVLNWIQALPESTLVRNVDVELRSKDTEFRDLINQILTGEIDVVIFLTANGLSHFFERAKSVVESERLINSLADITTIVTGKLTLSRSQSIGLEPTFSLSDSVEWRELTVVLDQQYSVNNRVVAVEANRDLASFAAGLEARGATVIPIQSYSFRRNDPTSEEQDVLDAIEDGNVDTLLLTNAICVHRFALLVKHLKRRNLNSCVEKLVVLSIGHEAADVANHQGLPCDVVINEDQLTVESSVEIKSMINSANSESKISPSSALDPNAAWYNSLFMRALRREKVETTPVWMMRQAGRYMQEYRDVRAKTSFLELCKNPQLCSEVMCTAVDRLGVDAAIIFSDLLPILEPMGCDLEFVTGDGPVIHNPIRSSSDIERIKPLSDNSELSFVMETVKQTRKELPASMPLIGFAGAPFSLASYMIEGGATRHYAITKQLMFSDIGAWNELMRKLTDSIKVYLRGQVEAGAQCIQLFDSWAGCLSVSDYRHYVASFVNEIIDEIAPLVPVINFATGNPALLPELAATQAAVIGIDWRIDLDNAWHSVGYEKAVQGNLDPTVLLSTKERIEERVKQILKRAEGRCGHIFNLGHGILPQTPVENAIAFVEMVHEFGQS